MRPFGTLRFENQLDSALVFTDTDLKPILRASLKKLAMPYAGKESAVERVPDGAHATYWDSDFFGLSQSALYQKLQAQKQQEVLYHCNRLTVEEAFYIEKSGMCYAAKMALLADTNDKRALYSLFCADEASHFHAINSFLLSEPAPYIQQPFLCMLDDLIHTGSYSVLVYMIQVVLEGWGLYHYRGMATYCQKPELADVLRMILTDEAKHHGSGLVILPGQKWTEEDSLICLPLLKRFMDLVRVGPSNILNAFEAVLGPLSSSEKRQLFADYGGEAPIAQVIEQVAKYIVEHCPDQKILPILEQHGCFQPGKAEDFAAQRGNH